MWFPFLSAERLDRQRLERQPPASPRASSPSAAPAEGGPTGAASPLVFAERTTGGLRLAALSRAAREAGLEPGLTLADARARRPDLQVVAFDPPADAAFLNRVADDCDRWTPLVALDAPDGLVLDISGCAHLFGGEAALRTRLLAHLKAHGLTAYAVVASTPDAARAPARCGLGGLIAPGEEARRLAGLPVAALGLAPATASGLSRAGLKTLGDLAGRPATPLAARFGEELLVKLRRTLGIEDARIVPRRPLPDCIAERRFAEPIARAADIEGALAQLVEDVGRMLEARGEGGRAFEASFFRTDGAVRRLAVETARPSREGLTLARLFRERLDSLADPLDPGFGFDLVRLAVLRAEPLAAAQIGLDGRVNEEEEVAALIDRLTTRLGRERVLRFVLRDSHDPARAATLVPAIDGPAPPAPMAETEAETLPRPITLFEPPQPIEALAEVPDGPPLRFRWRRVLHEVARAEGPERVAPEWWRRLTAQTAPEGARTRDYYRVENREGRRFWLFRAGLYERGGGTPRWFLHGLFP
ncbi:DNA polymerase Y family protein [Ancylobacter sp. Lp-2]|uniref:Y-family DNA polymerase n=1 Tax=Ancylobacter sp. Lp-2 TaxID=2881339 RepID=UPI00210854E3|nr:DNA polymerase Y family protein [Ancylobacter sp. Lp-2]MCB4768441.1 DNA polymerase Y family protein [Ancylobacter sp. Lp-2]